MHAPCAAALLLAVTRALSSNLSSSLVFCRFLSVFVFQFTRWGPGELEAEVERGLWRPAVASKMALLRVRDRKGPDVAKPMWTDLSEMAGGDYLEAMKDFYSR